MSKLYKLKEWFSLEDAAGRLSGSLGELVSTSDVLQLVLDEHIPLSWYARHAPAERVVKGHGVSMAELRKWDRVRMSVPSGGTVSMPIAHARLKEEGTPLEFWGHSTWVSPFDGQVVERINGVYRLELKECGALKDWVHSLITHTGGELITLEGFIVSDQEGGMWRILTYMPGNKYKSADGTTKDSEPFYYPSNDFPDLAELVIQRCDIEAFEARIDLGSQSRAAAIGSREREALLTIMGGLLGLLLGKTSTGKPQSVYENQAAVIDALIAQYGGKGGMSRRNLEDKLALAKRTLTSS